MTFQNKTRIAHIISDFAIVGGVEWVVYEIIKGLNKSKFKSILFCLTKQWDLDDSKSLKYMIRKEGIEIIDLNFKSTSNPIYFVRNIRNILKLCRLLKKNEIDIVQTHEFFSGTLGRVAAMIAKVPIRILMLHSCHHWKLWYHIFIDRFLARRSDVLVANSDSVKRFTSAFENIPITRFKTIYNGIDLRCYESNIDVNRKKREFNIENIEPILCSVGRMAFSKGYKFLINALPQVIKEFPQMKLLIIGGGGVPSETTEEEIKRLVKTLGLTKNIKFLGWRKDVGEILSICDLFVLPSLWEGFGLSIVEAMAAGKPVVATNVDAIPEVVSDGETGILVPPKDPNALANAIITLLEDPEKMRKMGQSGKKRAFDLFSAKRMTKDFEKLYLSLYNKNNMLIT